MSNDKQISQSKTKNTILARTKQKSWMQKLETVSGQSIRIDNKSQGTIYLLIDCSGSMNGNKLDQAKNGSKSFAEDAKGKGYAIGIIQFDSDAKHLLEPEFELNSFHSTIEKLTLGGSTNMAAGIRLAINNLKDGNWKKVMCIITDGQPDDYNETLNAANEAKQLGIEIMTIGTDDADKNFLEQIATSKKLSIKVESKYLQQGISSMAKLLPDKT